MVIVSAFCRLGKALYAFLVHYFTTLGESRGVNKNPEVNRPARPDSTPSTVWGLFPPPDYSYQRMVWGLFLPAFAARVQTSSVLAVVSKNPAEPMSRPRRTRMFLGGQHY